MPSGTQDTQTSPRTVIITGGSSGIGLETARRLTQDGNYRVVLISKDKRELENAAASLPRELVSYFTCELTDIESLQSTVDKILANHKQIYALINNAGVYPFGSLLTTPLESWEETFDINLRAPFLLAQAFAPILKKNAYGGRIINISSTAGILPNHFALAYSVSKAALIHLTKTLAKELGKDNITVNCIAPGIVKSSLHENYHSTKSDLENFYAKKGSTMPMGRVGEPSDIAHAIEYLLSDSAGWVTGDVQVIDGGRLLV